MKRKMRSVWLSVNRYDLFCVDLVIIVVIPQHKSNAMEIIAKMAYSMESNIHTLFILHNI